MQRLVVCDTRSPSVLREHALGGGDAALPPGVHLAGLPQRAGEGLEGGLHDVVAVAAAQLPDVQRHARRVGQRLEEVLHQLRLVLADALGGQGQVAAEVRPPRQVLRHSTHSMRLRDGLRGESLPLSG